MRQLSYQTKKTLFFYSQYLVGENWSSSTVAPHLLSKRSGDLCDEHGVPQKFARTADALSYIFHAGGLQPTISNKDKFEEVINDSEKGIGPDTFQPTKKNTNDLIILMKEFLSARPPIFTECAVNEMKIKNSKYYIN